METKAEITTTTQQNVQKSLTENQKVKTNIITNTFEDKQRLFNITSRCDFRLNDVEGKILNIKEYYLSYFTRKDKNTGEPRNQIRTIIIDDTGKSYVTLSNYFALQFIRFIEAFGDEIKNGIKIKIVKITKEGKEGKILQFELVTENQTTIDDFLDN